MGDESELLRRFAEEGAQEAFTELVRQRVDFVYSAALRQVGGDGHLAEDVTQAVFLALAREAPRLKDRPVLAGWLYTAAHHQAAMAARGHRRWRQREREATTMNMLRDDSVSDAAWARLRPVLDEAMHELDDRDREAVLLRYFDGRAFAEIGTKIGQTENAARMRVERALEKLHGRLAQRGIGSTTAALATILTQESVTAAPLGLAGAAASASLAAPAVATLTLMSTTKLTLGLAIMSSALGIGVYLAASDRLEARLAEEDRRQNVKLAGLRAENLQLRRDLAASAPVAPQVSDAKASLQVAADIVRSGLMGQKKWSFPQPGTLEVGIVDAAEKLGLSGSETSALQQAADAGTKEFATAIMAHATVRQEGERVTIDLGAEDQVPARAAYNGMIESMHRVLGPERSDYLDALGFWKTLDQTFEYRGLGLNSWSFTRVAMTANTPGGRVPVAAMYDGTYSTKNPTVLGPPTGRYQTSSPEILSNMLGPLQALLPPGF